MVREVDMERAERHNMSEQRKSMCVAATASGSLAG